MVAIQEISCEQQSGTYTLRSQAVVSAERIGHLVSTLPFTKDITTIEEDTSQKKLISEGVKSIIHMYTVYLLIIIGMERPTETTQL